MIPALEMKKIKPTPISLYKTTILLGSLYFRIKRQEKYLRKQVAVILKDINFKEYLVGNEKAVCRTIKYWQLGLNLICENVYRLTGNSLNKDEYERIGLLSLFAPLYDDMFDDKILGIEDIKSFTSYPYDYKPGDKIDKMAHQLYLKILSEVPDPSFVIQQLEQVFRWQKASLKQFDANISEKELYEITYYKSYHSILLYCSILDHYPTQVILDMLLPLAGLMQLTNDAFDVYKDNLNGVYTIPNRYQDIEKLKCNFLSDVNNLNKSVREQCEDKDEMKKYTVIVHSLNAMGLIAIEKLQDLKESLSPNQSLNQLNRKELVCDMDNWSQRFRWIKQVYYLSNYVN